jgi:hypothetical protein
MNATPIHSAPLLLSQSSPAQVPSSVADIMPGGIMSAPHSMTNHGLAHGQERKTGTGWNIRSSCLPGEVQP